MQKHTNHSLGNRVKKVLYTISIGWTLTMGYLLLTPGSDLPKELFFKGEDKLIHFILFFVWSQLIAFILFRKGKSTFRVLSGIYVVGLVLAVGTEYLQVYVPNRVPEFWDGLADFIGVLIGGIVGIQIKKELPRLENTFNK